MDVVWHEAVRNYCEAIFRRRARNLRKHEFNNGGLREQRATMIGAERQGIPMQADVVGR